MKMPKKIEPAMLAPCGVVCAACGRHLKKKKPCGGCHGPDEVKNISCIHCVRKNCADEKGLTWCFECGDFPCKLVKTLDKSYRTRYGFSLIENGRQAKALGVEAFLKQQRLRHLCPQCGGAVCQHDGICSECGEGVLSLPKKTPPAKKAGEQNTCERSPTEVTTEKQNL